MWVYVYSLPFVATVKLRYTITGTLKHVAAETHCGEGRENFTWNHWDEVTGEIHMTHFPDFRWQSGRTYVHIQKGSSESLISKSESPDGEVAPKLKCSHTNSLPVTRLLAIIRVYYGHQQTQWLNFAYTILATAAFLLPREADGSSSVYHPHCLQPPAPAPTGTPSWLSYRSLVPINVFQSFQYCNEKIHKKPWEAGKSFRSFRFFFNLSNSSPNDHEAGGWKDERKMDTCVGFLKQIKHILWNWNCSIQCEKLPKKCHTFYPIYLVSYRWYNQH